MLNKTAMEAIKKAVLEQLTRHGPLISSTNPFSYFSDPLGSPKSPYEPPPTQKPRGKPFIPNPEVKVTFAKNDNYDIIIKPSSLSEMIKFAHKSADNKNGSAIALNVNEWTDHYGFSEFVNDYFSLKNKNAERYKEQIQTTTKILKKLIDKHKHHFMPQNTFQEYHDMAGAVVDVGRYLQNDPECMINFHEPNQKKVINMFYQMGVNSHQSTILVNIGVITYCLNNLLKNRSINIYGINKSGNDHDNKYRIIYVPLMLSTVTALTPQIEVCLLNACALFRRVIFGVFEGSPDDIREKYGMYEHGPAMGYGSSTAIGAEEIKEITGIEPDILIDSTIVDDDLPKSCERLIEKIVSAIKKQEHA